MKKEKRINIDIPENIWNEFSIACVIANKTKKEAVAEALVIHAKHLQAAKRKQEKEA